jgi:Phage P22-like portal protein
VSAPTPKEIREAFQEYRSEWKDIYDEGQEDMRYIAGDPWDPADRQAREDAGRPCLSLDELNQYVNQYVNNLRQQKLGVKVTPKGNGANDDDAKNRANLIRGVEDESNAPSGAYITAAESAASRGYGFAVLRTEYKDESSFDQTIRIERVANPDTILINPFYKQANASDISDGFIVDRILKTAFKEKYPKAKITNFTGEIMGESGVSDWITEKMVQEGEYWKIEHDYKTLLLVESPNGPVILSEDEYEKMSADLGAKTRVIRDRRVPIPKVMQYMTNGLEILDEIPWAGSRIPIISCFGKELYLNEGGRAVRKLMSLIRLARDPQMLFAYLATQECEEAGMVPKVPFVGAKGQFESDSETWEEINKVPHSYVQYDIVIDGVSGAALPAPTRPQYVANFQQYEIAKDSARRSIQSAMGITPLPTAAQRSNEKSGVALDKIETQESVGSFHFGDNFKMGFLHNMGWQINELITPILDTQREEPITKPDGTHATMSIVGKTSHPLNDQGVYDVQGLPEDHYHTGKGDFGVTISDGPNFQSEREEQSEFVDHLIANWQTLGVPPGVANKVLAKMIRMKDLGQVGDDIANLLDPPDASNLPPEAQAQIAQLQGQLQQLTQENSALHMDRAGRVLEQQTKKEIEALKGQNAMVLQHIKTLGDLIGKELAAKSRSTDAIAERDASLLETQLGFNHDQVDRAHDAAHELAMTSVNHENAKDLASQSAALQPPPAADGQADTSAPQ